MIDTYIYIQLSTIIIRFLFKIFLLIPRYFNFFLRVFVTIIVSLLNADNFNYDTMTKDNFK